MPNPSNSPSQGAQEPPDTRSMLLDLQSCVDNIECGCVDPPPDDKWDDYEAHAQYCHVYLHGYIGKLLDGLSGAQEPPIEQEQRTDTRVGGVPEGALGDLPRHTTR